MNFMSSFSLYEIFRILVPGIYSMLMISDAIQAIEVYSKFKFENFGTVLLFSICAILIGGFLYSLDVPRWFSKFFPSLPSNLIKQNNVLKNRDNSSKRFEENEYFKFYYEHLSDTKYKTEIQSGLLHLFINLAFVSLISSIVYVITYFASSKINPFLIINSILFFISVLSTIILYHQKLKYSWKRNYEEFVDYVKSEKNVVDN